jgi:uncharacterized membrane protein
MKNFYIILLSAIVFVVLDFIYLNLISGFFKSQIETIQKSSLELDILATIFCYLFLVFGLNYFILSQKKSILDAFLLGLVIYAVYEFTNKGLFTKWNYSTVIIDTLWGGVLFALTTYIVYTFSN